MLEFSQPLRGVPVVITGAGGWLGQAALEMAHNAGAKIYAFGASARPYTLRHGATLPIHALHELARLEARFTALGQALGIPTVLMRVFNLAGPFINKLDSYALACIIRDIMARRPVTLRATHPVWRGYAHVADVLNIALGLLLRGESPPVFDTWGEPIELSALAARAAALLGWAGAEIIRPEWQNGAADKYLGDAVQFSAHAASLGIEPASLDRQILDTADYLGRCFPI